MSINARLHEWFDGAYYVGIVENANDVIRNPKYYASLDIHWLDLGTHVGSWFADPFILKADENTITLLVEEYEYTACKGILSEVQVDRRTYKLLNVRPLLRQDTHLSFPYFITVDDQVKVVPESGQRNEVAIYKYDDEGCLQRQRVLIDSKCLDTQIFKIGDKWYAFATKATGEGLASTRQLYIYEADSFSGNFREIQCFVNTKNEERGAGLMFEYDGHILRPAQVCEGGYGKGVILYDVKHENGKFVETEYARFMADPKRKNGLCLHTFSVYENLIAVDGFDYKYRWIGKINPVIYKIKNCINKIVRK